MYMSSKERLREKEQERKRTSAGGNTKGLASDRLPIPTFDSESFMAETAIGEEPEDLSTTKHELSGATNDEIHTSSAKGGSYGGIGSGRFIPTRDSSLRKTASGAKRSTRKSSSRHRSTPRASEDANDTIQEMNEQRHDRKRERGRRNDRAAPAEGNSKMEEPLDNLDIPRSSKTTTLASTQVAQSAGIDEVLDTEDIEGGAPSPAVAQRKSRHSLDQPKRRSGKGVPEPLETPQAKKTGSRLKRLSAPLSPRAGEKEAHNRSSSTPLSRVGSPEPGKTPQIHIDDRPTSADSIDDAVEAYLCSPRLSQKIRHPQTGRTISFSEVGDSEGFAVFCCVGMGLTRYITAFYDELALTLKLRLITPDRPGVGDSEPYNDGTATPLSWPGM